MSLLSRLWRRIFGGNDTPAPTRPTQPATPARVDPPSRVIFGLNVHELSSDTLDFCRAIGVRHLRFTVYADQWWQADSAAMAVYRIETTEALKRASDQSFDMLVVIHGGDPHLWPELAHTLRRQWLAHYIQLGNENDGGAQVVTPTTYSIVFANALERCGGGRLVTAQAGGETRYFSRAVGGLDAEIRAHAGSGYGPPPGSQARQRAMILRDSHPAVPVWITELGYGFQQARDNGIDPEMHPTVFENTQRDMLEAASTQLAGVAERVYLYDDNRKDDGGFSLRRVDGSWRPMATWLKEHQKPRVELPAFVKMGERYVPLQWVGQPSDG